MIFTNGNGPADAATPRPTTTVTASPKAAEKAAEAASKPPGSATKAETGKAATAAEKRAQAGDKGPFKDAQKDGKYMDDFGKSVMPNGVGVSVPDALLPFPGAGEEDKELPPGVVPAEPDSSYPDPDAGTDTSDDVVSGTPGEVTNPDAESAPVTDARPGPAPGPVRPGGPGGVLPPGVVPVGPVLNSVTGVVSSALPE
ncbi:hypothetical protein ACFYPC_21310 [Streptomyces sp. NPDC005808]|uniref:hypothetical protein n=1 Tax=Streptomyces sp. NPDC005808 TaxID=3364734 RepID=UPI003698BBE0